jgi:hypothetical protein
MPTIHPHTVLYLPPLYLHMSPCLPTVPVILMVGIVHVLFLAHGLFPQIGNVLFCPLVPPKLQHRDVTLHPFICYLVPLVPKRLF